MFTFVFIDLSLISMIVMEIAMNVTGKHLSVRMQVILGRKPQAREFSTMIEEFIFLPVF